MNQHMESRARDKQFPDWKTISSKHRELDDVLLEHSKGKVNEVIEYLINHEELHLYHSYANAVAVRRLGFNDHGPVHARIVTYNTLKLLQLLHDADIDTSLEEEGVGSYEDSQIAAVLGAFLHDIGMGVTREAHEWHTGMLVDPYIREALDHVYPEGHSMRTVVRAMAHEAIVGHMATVRIHSLEAGAVLVADGTDMSKGRSRIPQLINSDPVVGDMHRFSASAITRVDICPGETKPIRIAVSMENVTGLFQIEEILMTKVKASPLMNHLEVCALVGSEEPRFYLK